MGIVNVTPDSFSDGGLHFSLDNAVRHAEHLVAEGADIIDVGGESTRPGALAVSVDEELNRVVPVIEHVTNNMDVCVSVDSSTPVVMTEAASAGAGLLNDVRALKRDGAVSAAARTGLPVCLMHMQGEPDTMQLNPTYADLLQEIDAFFSERVAVCRQHGIGELLLDPGFGFGKLPEHNLQLVNQLSTFRRHDLPLLVGVSRKSTIAKVTDDLQTGSVVGALIAAQNGAKVLRVHDVAPTVAALRVWKSITGESLDREQ